VEVIDKEFVNYEIALQMKELGFNEPCFKAYTEEYKQLISNIHYHTNTSIKNVLPTKPFTAPTYSQCFRFFREKYGIEGFVHKSIEGNYYFVIKRIGNNESNMYEFTKNTPKNFNTYEESEQACLIKLIELCQNQI
jgi:hypothetical protein